MSLSLFLVCLFLIAACTEGAVIDKEKGMNDTALLQLLHHISKRHDISLERRQNCAYTNLPFNCTTSKFYLYTPSTLSSRNDLYLSSLNSQYSTICTTECVRSVLNYYRCIYSGDRIDRYAILFQQYLCGQQDGSGDYCPVKILRSFNTAANRVAFNNIYRYCDVSSITATNRFTLCSSYYTYNREDCIAALNNFTSAAGCCMEPLFGSGVRSCNGVSVPDACTGVSSAPGIIATPIVGVSLMILALAGVFL